jgi:hypothetical protein
MSANSTRQKMLLTKDKEAQPLTAVWRPSNGDKFFVFENKKL